MIDAGFLLSILTLVGGTYFGITFGEQFRDYLVLVDNFSVYLAIFNHELSYIKSQKPAGQRFNSWNKFSLVRDYLMISILRLALIPGIELALTGNIAQYDFVEALRASKSNIGFAVGSLFVIVGFYELLTNTFFSKFITIGCACSRYFRSIAIFEMHKSNLSATASIIEMVKLNTMNGAYTLTATTVVDILFRGSLTPIKTWTFTRSCFAAIPLVQIYFLSFGSAIYQQLFIQASSFGKTAGINIPAQLGDGFKVITFAFCFYGYLFAYIPEKIISNLFK